MYSFVVCLQIIHLSSFSKQFIRVMVMVDQKSMPGMLDRRWEFTMDEVPCHCMEPTCNLTTLEYPVEIQCTNETEQPKLCPILYRKHQAFLKRFYISIVISDCLYSCDRVMIWKQLRRLAWVLCEPPWPSLRIVNWLWTHPVEPRWHGPGLALGGRAALEVQRQRAAQQNNHPHTPPAPYSASPSSASAQPPPPAEPAPPHAAALPTERIKLQAQYYFKMMYCQLYSTVLHNSYLFLEPIKWQLSAGQRVSLLITLGSGLGLFNTVLGCVLDLARDWPCVSVCKVHYRLLWWLFRDERDGDYD